MTKMLVCGDRNWDDRQYLYLTLDTIASIFHIEVVVEGGARGADSMAREWAESRGIPFWEFEAEWEVFGKSAGPRRNQEMLNRLQADNSFVVAFHNDLKKSKGTKDMLERARKKGIATWVFPGEGDVKLDVIRSSAYV